jgi:hypothetical protein
LYNKRQDDHLIKECLDRGIANPQWVHLFPHFSVKHLSAHSFDHNPIILDTTASDLSLPQPFRFEEFWTYDPSCGLVISSAWNNTLTGSPLIKLSKNPKNTKQALRYWNTNHSGIFRSVLRTLFVSLILFNKLLHLLSLWIKKLCFRNLWMIFIFKKNLFGETNPGKHGSLVKILIQDSSIHQRSLKGEEMPLTS